MQQNGAQDGIKHDCCSVRLNVPPLVGGDVASESPTWALSARFKAVPSEHERLTLCRRSVAAGRTPKTSAVSVAGTRHKTVRRNRFILVLLPVLVTSTQPDRARRLYARAPHNLNISAAE